MLVDGRSCRDINRMIMVSGGVRVMEHNEEGEHEGGVVESLDGMGRRTNRRERR